MATRSATGAAGERARPSAAPAAPYAAPATLVVQPGDNLWALTESRLAGAGLPVDDSAVAAHLRVVIDLNADAVADPDLIYVGQALNFPAIGEPSAAPPAASPPAPIVPQAVDSPPVLSPPATNGSVPAPTAAATRPAGTTSSTTTTSTTSTAPVAPEGGDDGQSVELDEPSSPIGIGEAALLSAGVLALVAARRRQRLRSARPRARVPEPPPGTVATERRLRSVDAGERLLRVDVAVRAAAAALVDGPARVAVVCADTDGTVELVLTADASLPAPWRGARGRWSLPGSTPLEALAREARSVGAPCVALAQLGVDADGRDVLADLEGLGLLSVVGNDPALADSVVRGIAASLAASVFAELANLVGVGLDGAVFLDHRHAHHAASIDEALELATTLIGTTRSAHQSTFTLRARHTSGEVWEPAIVLAASAVADDISAEVVDVAARRRRGLAMVVAGAPPGAPWALRERPGGAGHWVLEPLGLPLAPVGLSADEVDDLHDVLVRADGPLERDPPDELTVGRRRRPVRGT